MPDLDIGDEVARLAEALQGWWTTVGSGGPAPSPNGGATDGQGEHRRSARHEKPGPHEHERRPHEEGSHGTASCRICPVCRVIDVVRAVRPELMLQVASAAETIAVLLREAAVGADEDPRRGDGDAPFERGTRIEVSDGRSSDEQGNDQEGSSAWA